jgi:hypothetical protein
MLAAAHHTEISMKRTLAGTSCLVVAVAILAACDAAAVTKPTATSAPHAAGPSATVLSISGDTVPPCPEIAIPELLCYRRDPRQPPRTIWEE